MITLYNFFEIHPIPLSRSLLLNALNRNPDNLNYKRITSVLFRYDEFIWYFFQSGKFQIKTASILQKAQQIIIEEYYREINWIG